MRRKANKQRSKIKQKLTSQQIEEFKLRNEQKKKDSEDKKKKRKQPKYKTDFSEESKDEMISIKKGISNPPKAWMDRDERKRVARELR